MTQNNNTNYKNQDSLLKKQFLEQLLGQEVSQDLGLEDLMKLQEKFNDPMLLSVLIFKLIEEKKQTNELLKTINEKYDKLQFMIKQNNKKEEVISLPSEIDDQILTYVRSVGRVDAEDVRQKFSYKGTNAASQRLNNLVKQGYLTKIFSGRKAYFLIK